MKKIVISCSAKFQEEIKKWKKEFEEKGFEVINWPKEIDQSNIHEYKTVHTKFFKSILEADMIFIINGEKNGIKGYVGAQTFAELSFAIIQNTIYNKGKEIYLLNEPGKEVQSYTELNTFIQLGWIKIYNIDK